MSMYVLKILTTLQWLKDSNPLYKNIAVITKWLDDVGQDDTGGTCPQLDITGHLPPSQSYSTSEINNTTTCMWLVSS